MKKKTKKKIAKKSKPSVKRGSKVAKKISPKKSVAKTKIKAKLSTRVTRDKKVEAVESAPQIEQSAQTVSVPSPIRAPMRKIIGAGNTLIVLPKPGSENSQVKASNAENEAGEAAPQKAIVIPLKPEVQQPIEYVRYAWDALPKSFPAHIRFLVNAAAEQCVKAASNPFGFAKMISSLPEKVCAAGFAILVMRKNHSEADIAGLCSMEVSEVRARLESVRLVVETLFSISCSEMYRKWNSLLRGTIKSIDAVIEPYLISKLSPDFQIMIGEVLLIVVGAEYINGAADEWRIANT